MRGVKIIWDFDDNVIVTKEVSRRGFDEMSKIAHVIVTGSPILQNLLKEKYQSKAIYLPTTDGDIWKCVDNNFIVQRLVTLKTEVRIIWVGTFPGLGCLLQLMPAMELLGEKLTKKISSLL